VRYRKGSILTKRFRASQDLKAAIDAASAALRAGELVAVPTETVYGLAADATDPDAVAAVFAAKERPEFNPLIVHVRSIEEARAIAAIDSAGERLAAAFWPGPLTLVAPRRPEATIAELASAGLDTVAVRVPSHPVAQALLASVPFPLVAPSANRSGRVSATLADHVIADLGDRVAVVLDAGPAPLGLESSIVGLGPKGPALLRPGAIGKRELERVLGVPLAVADTGERPDAPGMLHSHYAPSVPVRLGATEVGSEESLLAFGARPASGAETAVAVVNLSRRGDLNEAAKRFFAALRELEAYGAPIAAMSIPDEGLGLAINDRLRRAAAPRDGG
jgi:L-threonylcarbamoyladenylate synthase